MTELEVDVLAADILNRHELSLGEFSQRPSVSQSSITYISCHACSVRRLPWSGSHLGGRETEKTSP